MFVSGFTIAKNAVLFDYPVKEAILSILPVCDEVVVSVGDSDDGTLELVQSIADSKVRIIRSVWDESLRQGGSILANETNKAFGAISEKADWAFYIQADEVLHEDSIGLVRSAMEQNLNYPVIEGLLFDYTHFYGSYDYVGDSPRWYRREVRVIRNDKRIRSYKDAQGFRIEGRKLMVRRSGAKIFHYGWVKDPRNQKQKELHFNRYWHDDKWMEEHVAKTEEYDYSGIDSLSRFEGKHPAVMQERIRRMNWKFDIDIFFRKLSLKHRLIMWIERLTGWRPGEYRNYRE